MSMMQRGGGRTVNFAGIATNKYGNHKSVHVAHCTGGSTDFGYITLTAYSGETTVHLDRDEITSLVEALTAVRDAIPARCNECGQVKPS